MDTNALGSDSSIVPRAGPREHVPTWLRVLLSIAILLGITFRFYDLPKKIYFYDEVLTSLHSSGYTMAEYNAQVVDGQIHSGSYFEKYQGAHPQRTVFDVIYALANEDPQHPPFYFILEHLYTAVIGDSLEARRTLAAVFGVLGIPAAAWLSFELFGSYLIAWLSAGLTAVSPFLLLYSQQAREYSLWSVLVMVSSALFVRAIRDNRLRTWILYATTMAVGLYTFIFFALVIVAHATFALLPNDVHRTRRNMPFVISATIAITAFAPWIAVIVKHRDVAISETGFSAIPLPISLLLARSIFNATSIFFDAEYRYGALVILVPIIMVLIMAALIYTAIRRVPRSSLFLLVLVIATALPLLLEDLLLHHSRSTATRYFMPALIGTDLLVAYYLGDHFANATRRSSKLLWSVAILGVLSAGVFSCTASLPLRVWWTNIQDANVGTLVDVIATYPHPVVLSYNSLLVLKLSSNMVGSNVRFAITRPSDVGPLADNSPTLLVSPSSEQIQAIRSMQERLTRISLPVVPRDPFVANVRALFARARGYVTKGDAPASNSDESIWLLQSAR